MAVYITCTLCIILLAFATPEKLSEDAYIPSDNLSKMGNEENNLTEVSQNKDTGATEIIRTVTLKDEHIQGRVSVLSEDDFKNETDKGLFKSVVAYVEECKKQVVDKLAKGQEIVPGEGLQKQFDMLLEKVQNTFEQVT